MDRMPIRFEEEVLNDMGISWGDMCYIDKDKSKVTDYGIVRIGFEKIKSSDVFYPDIDRIYNSCNVQDKKSCIPMLNIIKSMYS